MSKIDYFPNLQKYPDEREIFFLNKKNSQKTPHEKRSKNVPRISEGCRDPKKEFDETIP